MLDHQKVKELQHVSLILIFLPISALLGQISGTSNFDTISLLSLSCAVVMICQYFGLRRQSGSLYRFVPFGFLFAAMIVACLMTLCGSGLLQLPEGSIGKNLFFIGYSAQLFLFGHCFQLSRSVLRVDSNEPY